MSNMNKEQSQKPQQGQNQAPKTAANKDHADKPQQNPQQKAAPGQAQSGKAEQSGRDPKEAGKQQH